jgi:hypothetical protein
MFKNTVKDGEPICPRCGTKIEPYGKSNAYTQSTGLWIMHDACAQEQNQEILDAKS